MSDISVHPELAAHGSFAHLRLGRKPRRRDDRQLLFARYLDEPGALPAAPPILDYYTAVPAWPMYGNDSLGDCLVEGSVVAAPGMQRCYRAPYDGPVVEIVTESGKRLTVTRNHAVLTARGFVRAHALHEGDYVLGSDRPEAVAMRMDDDLDHVPARVEEIFATHARVGAAVGVERRVCSAVEFHGDARFFDGEIDVVDADRLLHRRNDAETGEVEGHFGFSLGREPRQALDGRSALQSHLRCVPAAAALGLRSESSGLATLRRHPGVAEKRDLAARPYLHASITQPLSEELPPDVELVAELLDGLAGLVTTDRVVEVRNRAFRGHVYDLSTASHWYIADGILTHNCTCAAAGHLVQAWSTAAGNPKTPADGDVEEMYWETGDPPSNSGSAGGPTDDGRDEMSVLDYWRQTGIGANPADRITAYAYVDPSNVAQVRTAAYLFGGLYIGVELPLTAQGQQTWDVEPAEPEQNQPGSWGGHAVPIVGYDDAGFVVVTWGATLRMTAAFFDMYVDEIYACISPDFLAASGESPAGFDLERLEADLTEITQP